jgi:hypothetical protein
MEQHESQSDTDDRSGIRARWAALDPAMRGRIVWITTLLVIAVIVLAVFALGFAGGRCKDCG